MKRASHSDAKHKVNSCLDNKKKPCRDLGKAFRLKAHQ